MEPNLHSSVVSMMEEAKWMTHLGMKVPPEASSAVLISVKKNYDQLKVYIVHVVELLAVSLVLQFLLEEEAQLWQAVPTILTSIMKYHIRKVSGIGA